MNGLFKTELIRRRAPWRTVDDVELATLGWVDWFISCPANTTTESPAEPAGIRQVTRCRPGSPVETVVPEYPKW